MTILIISCIFGKKFKKVYPAPSNKEKDKYKCLFFTNNKELLTELVSKGWTPVFIRYPLSENNLISSLQSKYIKFLQFLNNKRFEHLKNEYKQILYFDHKFYVLEEHIDKLIQLAYGPILIRSTPHNTRNIWAEVNQAKGQDRYKNGMPKTIQLINYMINQKQINSNVTICNTGIIFYNDITSIEVTQFLQNIYNACINLSQPECQIFWAIYSQTCPGRELIKVIPFSEVSPLWKCPN